MSKSRRVRKQGIKIKQNVKTQQSLLKLSISIDDKKNQGNNGFLKERFKNLDNYLGKELEKYKYVKVIN